MKAIAIAGQSRQGDAPPNLDWRDVPKAARHCIGSHYGCGSQICSEKTICDLSSATSRPESEILPYGVRRTGPLSNRVS